MKREYAAKRVDMGDKKDLRREKDGEPERKNEISREGHAEDRVWPGAPRLTAPTGRSETENITSHLKCAGLQNFEKAKPAICNILKKEQTLLCEIMRNDTAGRTSCRLSGS